MLTLYTSPYPTNQHPPSGVIMLGTLLSITDRSARTIERSERLLQAMSKYLLSL